MKKAVAIRLRAIACMAALLQPRALPGEDLPGRRPPYPYPLYQVRIGVLMVSMPEEKYLALMPDLLDKAKIYKVVSAILDAVKRKEMVLEGYPFLVTKSAERAGIETNCEKSGPCDWIFTRTGHERRRNAHRIRNAKPRCDFGSGTGRRR